MSDASFAQVLEAADQLSEDEQQELMAILRRRLADAARRRLVTDVEEARREFAEGHCSPTSAADLLGKIVP
jgi:DNA-binding TFAR19-related protein (PDSD5 family)